MLFVTPEERTRRLNICKGCKYYKANTQSCGTLLRPRTLRNGVKLCGCFMPAKTKFKYSACPANFWQATVTKEDQDQIKNVIQYSGQLTVEQTKTLVNVYSKATGTSNNYTACNSCLARMQKELQAFLSYPIDSDVKEATQQAANKYREINKDNL